MTWTISCPHSWAKNYSQDWQSPKCFSLSFSPKSWQRSPQNSESSGRWRWPVFSNTESVFLSTINYNIQLSVWDEIRYWNKVLSLDEIKMHCYVSKQKTHIWKYWFTLYFQGGCIMMKILVLRTICFSFLH